MASDASAGQVFSKPKESCAEPKGNGATAYTRKGKDGDEEYIPQRSGELKWEAGKCLKGSEYRFDKYNQRGGRSWFTDRWYDKGGTDKYFYKSQCTYQGKELWFDGSEITWTQR
ncbi:hypothetical protein [Streptomyces aureoversilis]|uniref:MORN repeat-containing protein n=1 Tax=Streptomyces aureoversilis TaxID=67277 RepID=A0ABW0A8B5_9ACTN